MTISAEVKLEIRAILSEFERNLSDLDCDHASDSDELPAGIYLKDTASFSSIKMSTNLYEKSQAWDSFCLHCTMMQTSTNIPWKAF